MYKIFNAHDMAEMQGFKDGHDRMRRLPMQGGDKPIMPVWDGRVCAGPPVYARIERGRWIAQCDYEINGASCRGAEWVAPGLPFFCFSCGNVSTGGKARPVIFPKDKEEIERALLERPMIDMVPGAHPIVRALNAQPQLSITTENETLVVKRNWKPEDGETAADLRKQHKFVAEMVNKIKQGKNDTL